MRAIAIAIGLVAVAVIDVEKGEAVIRNWVMSCRVFSRRLEHAMLELVRKYAEAGGVSLIRAPFKLSAKNDVARAALVELGFVDDDGESFVVPTVATRPLPPHFIRIEGATGAMGQAS